MSGDNRRTERGQARRRAQDRRRKKKKYRKDAAFRQRELERRKKNLLIAKRAKALPDWPEG